MEASSTSKDSLPSHLREVTNLENEGSRSRVPRQHPASSTRPSSEPSSKRLDSSHIASPRYVKQFQALMEHQRQVHNEERALWHTERSELQERIAQLEASLDRYQNISSSQVSSPVDKNHSSSNSSFWSLLSTDGSRHSSASGTGDEVWRGPKIDAQPKRTFSESSSQSIKSRADKLSSIAEELGSHSDQKPSEKSVLEENSLRNPSIHSASIDRNLDGINFKSASLSPTTVKSVMTPQSPSPQSPSPSHLSPGTIPLSHSRLEVPFDPYTKDAGHTPLARGSFLNVDGTSSAGNSDGETPTQPEIERPPLEPRPTSAKIPSERSDSYFPTVDESHSNDDPELTGPLGLVNDKSEDKKFLNVLDSKLLQAAREETYEPPAVSGASEGDIEAEREAEEPDHEPKLRIKRSMNFGTVFGAKSCGKDA